ncbi:MAG TPA: hypothetical protein VLE43_19715 [Candidatus Saccharimonadia bacterium]|nr:hypothetical protein [Candidatus Saccharimonadia bacterium]
MRVLFLLSEPGEEANTVADMELAAVPRVGDAVQLKLSDGSPLLLTVSNVLWDLRTTNAPLIFVWGQEDK